MKLVINYKNGTQDTFTEKDLNCDALTIRGHASKMLRYIGTEKFYQFDDYNAFVLSEVISIRVID